MVTTRIEILSIDVVVELMVTMKIIRRQKNEPQIYPLTDFIYSLIDCSGSDKEYRPSSDKLGRV